MLNIRDAVKEDAGELACLVNLAGEGIPAYLWEKMAERNETAMDVGIRRIAGEGNAFSYINGRVAVEHNTLLGMIIAYRLPDPYPTEEIPGYPDILQPLVKLEAMVPGSWYINAIATFPDHRGKGVAGQLISDSISRAHQQGCKRISLIVASENSQARRLYEHLGFGTIATLPVVPYPGCLHGGEWALMTRNP